MQADRTDPARLTDRQRIILQTLRYAVVNPTPQKLATRTGSTTSGVVRSLRRGQELGLWARNLHDQWYATRYGLESLDAWEAQREEYC